MLPLEFADRAQARFLRGRTGVREARPYIPTQANVRFCAFTVINDTNGCVMRRSAVMA